MGKLVKGSTELSYYRPSVIHLWGTDGAVVHKLLYALFDKKIL